MTRKQVPGEISDLTDELFSKVQRAQAAAFISDGWYGAKTKAEFLKWAQDRLDWNNETGKIIRAFIRKHKKSEP